VACSDPATTYLNSLGYNVVRHPQESIEPLGLIGRQGGVANYLGTIDQLIENPQPGTLPSTETDLVAADINGQSSSALKVAVGANILGSVIGAMGGNLGVDTSYTNARKMQFHFSGVLKDRATPASIGQYLRNQQVDGANPLFQQYIMGNGRLYVITEVVRTQKLTVQYERDAGVAAAVDIPAVQGLVGGSVSVTQQAAQSGTLSYSGTKYLTFGFRCFEIGVADGELSLVASPPSGGTALSATEETPEAELAKKASILSDEGEGLLNLTMPAS
jgi:hypothetical protein